MRKSSCTYQDVVEQKESDIANVYINSERKSDARKI